MDDKKVEAYLKRIFGPTARYLGASRMGSLDLQGMKEFGYGKPLMLHYEVDGKRKAAVFSTMSANKYGHQFYWDRAAILMCQHDTARRMERHVPMLGLGYLDGDENLVPVNDPQEFFLLTDLMPGHDYYLDLDRIRRQGLEEKDFALAGDLAAWLAGVHAEKRDDPDLYLRGVRQLIGDSECIFGIVDGYPHPYEHFPPERFAALEKKLVDWRWRLRGYTHRLASVHGDFHPWNVLVEDDGGFSVLDRSRGEWSEPADDLATMALNYVLFGIYDEPRLQGDFERLYMKFFERYLELTGDEEILEVIAPYFVFRGLVIASPEWYPNHPLPVRQGLFRFLENVLEDGRFSYDSINKYMERP